MTKPLITSLLVLITACILTIPLFISFTLLAIVIGIIVIIIVVEGKVLNLDFLFYVVKNVTNPFYYFFRCNSACHTLSNCAGHFDLCSNYIRCVLYNLA